MGYLHPIHTSRGLSVLASSPQSGSLIAWLEPAKQGGTDAATVASLTNFAGGAAWPAPGASNRATYEAAGLNGLAVLDFDGDDGYTVPAFGDLTSFTLTMLVRLDAYDGATYNNRTLFSWADSAGTSGDIGAGALLIAHDAAGLQLYCPSGTNDLDISAVLAETTWHVVTVQASTTGGTLYFNRASAGTDTAAITFAFDRGFLGAYESTGLALGGHFKLACALLYNSNAAANRTAAEAYILSRFGE